MSERLGETCWSVGGSPGNLAQRFARGGARAACSAPLDHVGNKERPPTWKNRKYKYPFERLPRETLLGSDHQIYRLKLCNHLISTDFKR
jgi:hypothetical protein